MEDQNQFAVNGAQELPSGIVSELGQLGPGSIIDITALARLMKRHPVSIKRAVNRGELPAPVRLMGKPVWTADSIIKHLEKRLTDEATRRTNARRKCGI